jgi:hypothetical protein
MINPLEIIVGLIYFFLFMGVGHMIAPSMTNDLTKKYFVIALALKMIGGMSVGLIYFYYYGYGDTVMYFNHGAHHIFQAFFDNPTVAFDLIFGKNEYNPQNFKYAMQIWSFQDTNSYFCVRVAGFINLFAFDTYAGCAILFAFLSFILIWRLFTLLVNLYPDMHKEFAISFFFMPSVFFWGSGILKDTITFAFLCLLVHAAFSIYYFKRNVFINVIMMIIAGFFIISLKIYILIAVVPCVAFLFLYGPYMALKNPVVKLILAPFVLTLATGVGFYFMQKVSSLDAKYNLETMAKTAESTARWVHYASEVSGGSSYSLGDYDFSTFGLIKKTIPAIVVTIFRPFIWEVRNPVMLMASLEAMFFIWLFYRSFLTRVGLNSLARSKSIIIPFCLIFAIIFAWAVGLTSYNFGTLVRYKIPMMPFFCVAMYMMYRNKMILLRQMGQSQKRT